ncbi:MAG: hypothetical protein CL927_13445 [Deltaproteobacteria bacterium]|nr:hypothetical protein [Deltaproteobacteria bacterium]
MSERFIPSLSSRETGHGIELMVKQAPFVRAGLPMIPVFIGATAVLSGLVWRSAPPSALQQAAGIVSGVSLVLCLVVAVAIWTFVYARAFVAHFTVTPVSLRVRAWMGSPRRLQTHTLPLQGLTLRYQETPKSRPPVYSLILSSTSHLTVPGLQCTTNDLEALIEAIWDRRARARALMGDGEAEIPAELRELVQVQQDGN